jgi:hypothetical protein
MGWWAAIVYWSVYSNPKPMPTNPLGLTFNPLIDPWVSKLTHARALMEQKPMSLRVAGTHCHP